MSWSGTPIPADWQTSLPAVAAALTAAGAARPQASDVHFHENRKPWHRQGAVLVPIPDSQPISGDQLKAVFAWIGGRSRNEWSAGSNATATVCDLEGRRWQAACYREIDGLSAAFKRLNENIPPLEQLGLPNEVRMLAAQAAGLVIAAGVARSGRSTTLASLVELINSTRQAHILIIEHPVEFLHKSKLSLVSHRDINPAERSTALRTALRSDPDVVLIGESTTKEDLQLCMSLAAAGHLVLTSMHAPDSAGACERIAAATGTSGRMLLSQVLQGVIAQRRLPDASDPRGCYVAAEVLLMNSAMRTLVKPGGDIDGLRNHLLSHRLSLDDALVEKCRRGEVAEDIARGESVDPEAFDSLLRRAMLR